MAADDDLLWWRDRGSDVDDAGGMLDDLFAGPTAAGDRHHRDQPARRPVAIILRDHIGLGKATAEIVPINSP